MSRIGDWELGDELGRGSTGRVYRARHVATGAVRAVKILEGFRERGERGDRAERSERADEAVPEAA